MELTVTYGCRDCENIYTETIKIRRGQTVSRDCDSCGAEKILEIQANKKRK